MPQMVMQRNFTVRSTKGHTIAFEKGVPIFVVPSMIEECMMVGAMPVEGEVLPIQEEFVQPIVPEGPAREAAIMSAFQKIIKSNQRNDFGASGRPKVRTIEKLIGFDISEKERDIIWEKHTALEAEKAHG